MNNLFAIESSNELKKFVTQDWAEELGNYISLEAFNKIKVDVKLQRQQCVVFPESKDVFAALNYPLNRVKVVIVGQDPYHNGNADGLAFSCKESLSPSLRQILQAIWYDECKQVKLPQNLVTMNKYLGNKNNWNLKYLAEQGVLLYNPTLTVNKAAPNSHKGMWKDFTNAVFTCLLRKEKVVWMLWGSEALSTYNSVSHNNLKSIDNRLVLTNEHPAAASYQQRVWECNHFTNCNLWLKSNNLTEIEWIQR